MECRRVEKLPEGATWGYEIKLDGYRAIAVKMGREAFLYSRRGHLLDREFPAIVFGLTQIPVDKLTLDGEIVALDEKGRPVFQELQNRQSTRLPIVFYAFDVLHHAGKDLLQLPLEQRRNILDGIAGHFSDPIRLSPLLRASLPALWKSAKQAGLEGLVAKRMDSTYEPGKRSGAWQKKRANIRDVFIIGGYIPGAQTFFELIVGQERHGKLYYLKRLRNGFVPHTRELVFNAIAPLRTNKCPFVNLPERKESKSHPLDVELYRQCVWVKPRVRCVVEFEEWTRSGNLRHAEFRELVQDDRDGVRRAG
jgi:DNA ligase D-like protein (predicted ligase)